MVMTMGAGTASTPESWSTKGAPCPVGLVEVSGEGGDHPLVSVDDHVADKSQLGLLGGIQHIPVNGVAVQDAGAGIGTVNKGGAVVGQHGLPAGHSRAATLLRPPENPAKKWGSMKPSPTSRSASAAAC